MLLKELKAHFGTYDAMNKALDLSATTYLVWKKRGGIPYVMQCFIEKETNRLFMAHKEHDHCDA